MLTKDSFPFTHIFSYSKILENMENYLYTRFSLKQTETWYKETNSIEVEAVKKKKKKKILMVFLQKSVQQVLILGHWKKLIRPPHFKTMFCRWQPKFES